MEPIDYAIYGAASVAAAVLIRWWWIGPILRAMDGHTDRLDALLRETRKLRPPATAPWRCAGCLRDCKPGEWTCSRCGALAP